MTDIKLNVIETHAIDLVLNGDTSDPVALMRVAGVNVERFFEFGDWRDVDFTKSCVLGVSFRGSDMRGAKVTAEQYGLIAKTRPEFLPDRPPELGGEQETNSAAISYDVFRMNRPKVSNYERMDADDLVGLMRSYNPRSDEDLVRRAYSYAMAMHDGQFRRSGEPYFTHPVAVAVILAEARMADEIIVAALLHDTIEDTRATHDELMNMFGADISAVVHDVTRLTNLNLSVAADTHADSYKALWQALTQDPRAVLIQFADRLHNMRTAVWSSAEKLKLIARETLEIYAPLVDMMGIQRMRDELEDLSFKAMNPVGRYAIMRRFITLQRQEGDAVSKIASEIQAEIGRAGIGANVYGHALTPFLIWRGMLERHLSFRSILDVFEFRVVCDTLSDCYAVQRAILAHWRGLAQDSNDYIVAPKVNGYQALHTSVITSDGLGVALQILTAEMAEVAQFGIALNWSYRKGERIETPQIVDLKEWVARIMKTKGGDDLVPSMLGLRGETNTDQVFCFTPRGDIVQLPRGATPLDFAYAIHTNIGSRTASARIDGTQVPLWTRLKNGQCVEIVCVESVRPEPSWIDIVTTGRAKAAIRRFLRINEQERD